MTIARRSLCALVSAAALVAAVGMAPAAAASSQNEITITAQDFSFKSPSSIPAGLTSITLKNKGGEPHQVQVARLKDGVTFAQLKAAAATSDPAAIVDLVDPVGGPNVVAPGRSATTIDTLEPGNYALICFVFSSDGVEHSARGMLRPLTVTKAKGASAPTPKARATITLKDFSFAFPPKGVPGHGIVAVTNEGTQSHEIAIYQLAPGKTLADASPFILVPPGAAPPPGKSPVTEVGGITGVSPGETGWLDLNLPKGNYVAACFFPDPTKNNVPHVAEGMLSAFKVT